MNSSELATELLFKLRDLNHTGMHRHMGESMRGESFLLHLLYNQGGSAKPGEMRDALGVSSARIAAVLNNLEKKGYLVRTADAVDRRKKTISLTEPGRLYVLSQRELLKDYLEQILTGLGEADAREYIRIIGRIVDISHQYACPSGHACP